MDESKKARLAELEQKRGLGTLTGNDEQEYQDLQRERAQRSQEDADAKTRRENNK